MYIHEFIKNWFTEELVDTQGLDDGDIFYVSQQLYVRMLGWE